MSRMRHTGLVTAVYSAALLTMAAAVAAAQGTLTGTVASQGTNEPLLEARVIVVGTSLFTTTGPDGKYTVRRVPAGTAEVRVIRVGYAEQKKSVTILDGQTATLNFTMNQTVVQLQEVVTTATGDQRRAEIGNAVENIGVPKVTESGAVRSVADVLNSRVPGVQVLSGTQTGTGARVRIRGISSLALSNDPIYVIDGVRMSANNSSIGYSTLGNNPSRLGDISPEEIENIEIVKGPSAATLYGTDAANGVVLITTKKGRAGSAKWTAFGEGGILNDRHHYSDNYTLAGHSPTGALLINSGQCTLPLASSGACIPDSVRIFNPIMNGFTTPLGYGSRQEYGMQLSAGTDAVRYFISGTRDDETGVFKLPTFERLRYDSLGVKPHPWTDRPNASLKHNFRANVTSQVNPQLDLGVNFSYANIDQRYSIESNGTAGIGSQAFGGPGYLSNGTVSGTSTPLWGYRAWTPAYTWEEKTGQRVNRIILGTNLNWRPYSWLQGRANIGTDLTDRVDDDLRMNGEAPPLTATYRDGFAGNNRTDIRNKTADGNLSASYTPSRWRWMNYRTTIGAQYNDYKLDQSFAEGTTLPPGALTPNAAGTPGSSTFTTLQKTLGFYVEELVGLRDRLFVTGALRSDQNSAFGTNFQRVFYPKASISYVLSDEDFFPKTSLVSSFRLRGAYGASGVQPGPNDAQRLFAAASASLRGIDQPVERYDQLGNKDLKPERSAEFEGGFESRLFNSRLQFDMSYYSRTTHDALINAIIAPSVGTGATTQRSNLGSIKNAGVELTLGGQLVDMPMFAMDMQLTASDNENKVVSLGNTPRQIGTSNWIVAGYPIRGLWARPIIGWEDKNHDGILTDSPNPTLDEVYVSNDTIFRGYAQPRYMSSLTTGLEFFKHKLRIQNLFDYRGGHLWYNNTERIRCVSRQNCNGLMNPKASFQEQAMVQATLTDPSKTLDGFFQSGAFIRWREMSATAQIPDRWISRTRAHSASLVFSIRNVGILTKYRGTDPESDFTASEGGDSPSEFQTFAAPTYFILRLNFGF
jgi:TonB-linked SusC/RagA family outer membrane protein